MSLSMYQASIPALLRALTSLQGLLHKAQAFAEARPMDQAALLAARLYPDMFPLLRQVQIASDNAKGCAARLAGQDIPRYEDTETTLPELQDRLQRTIDYLNGFSATQIDGSEDRAITLNLPGTTLSFTGQSYLLGYVLPNTYFHVSMAYAILRQLGVDVGKRDYLGKLDA